MGGVGGRLLALSRAASKSGFGRQLISLRPMWRHAPHVLRTFQGMLHNKFHPPPKQSHLFHCVRGLVRYLLQRPTSTPDGEPRCLDLCVRHLAHFDAPDGGVLKRVKWDRRANGQPHIVLQVDDVSSSAGSTRCRTFERPHALTHFGVSAPSLLASSSWPGRRFLSAMTSTASVRSFADRGCRRWFRALRL